MTSPGESTCDTAVGVLKRVGPDAALAHLTPSSAIRPVCRSLLTAPPSSRPGWKPIRADWSLVSSTTASRHGEISESDLTSASLTPQSPVMSSLDVSPRPPFLSSKFARRNIQNPHKKRLGGPTFPCQNPFRYFPL